MSFRTLVLVGLVALLASGCACRRTTGNNENIGIVSGDSDLKDIHYAFDSYALNSEAKATLDANAAWLKEHGDRKVQVEGHCDERGTNEYNMVLGMNRAKAAMNYLRSMGVEGDRMSTVSYGEELPLDPAHDEGAWAKNRRAHFNLQ